MVKNIQYMLESAMVLYKLANIALPIHPSPDVIAPLAIPILGLSSEKTVENHGVFFVMWANVISYITKLTLRARI